MIKKMSLMIGTNVRLGFIGIGNMGSRMARRLLEHGYRVMVYDRTREAAEALVKYGATEAVIAPALLGKLSSADSGDYNAQFPVRPMSKDFGLVLETAAAAMVPMPATAAAFQANIAELAESKEEDFSAVIPLMESLAALNPTKTANQPTPSAEGVSSSGLYKSGYQGF